MKTFHLYLSFVFEGPTGPTVPVLHSNLFLRSGLKILYGEGVEIQVLQHNTNQIKTREKLSPKPADTAEVGALECYMKAATMLELHACQPLR
jgi:hypothetical protein